MKIVGQEAINAELVGHYGFDMDVVKAARVSTGNKTIDMGEKEQKLIKYLANHDHTTPFEMVDFKFLITVPIYIARQFHRHRTFSYNEWSGRYSEVGDEFYLRSRFNKQSTHNKQGSDDNISDSESSAIRERMEYVIIKSYEAYQFALDKGVSKEQARIVLSQNMMTKFYAKGNLHNWMHYCKQRCDLYAQEEHQIVAKQIFKHLLTTCPISVGALAKKRFTPETLSAVGLQS